MEPIKKSTYCKIAASVVAIVLIAIVAWAFGPKSYDEMIPAEAKAVLCIDGKAMSKALSDKDKEALETWGTEAFDLSEPLYGVVTPNEYLCLIAKVKDKDKVKDVLSRYEGKSVSVDEYDGREWAWLTDGWLASWDGRSFICVGPGVAQERDVLRQTITSMVNSCDKFVDTPAYKQLMQQQKALKVFAQLDAIPAPYNLLFRFNIPADCDPAAVQVFATADLKLKNQMLSIDRLDCNITSENVDIVNAIDSYEKEKGCIELDKQHLNVTTLFSLTTCLRGKDLLKLLKTDATLRGLLMGLNQTFDADRLLGSTDGLFNIEIGSFAKDWTPSFCLKAETHTPNLLADASYWLESAKKQKNVTLTRNTPNDFFLESDKQQLHFGLMDNGQKLYFASPSMLKAAESAFSYNRTKCAEGRCLVHFDVNIDLLNQQPCMKEGNAAAMINKLFPNNAHKISFEALTGRKATLKFE